MSPNPKGILYAVGAYVLWGLLPVYWKTLQSVPALEILAHRMVWTFGFLAGLILVRREGRVIWQTLSDRRSLVMAGTAAGLIAVNWFTYIYAVNADQIVETSLGYYANPLVNVLFGVVFLRERLRRLQWLAVALAAAAVAYLTCAYGRLPWIALVLALTFSCYALVKKKTPLGALHGLVLETAVFTLPALGALMYLAWKGTGAFGRGAPSTSLLLMLTGLVTSLPLLLFASAAARIKLSTIGLLQYISPTCGLLLGVLLYHEPFTSARALGFGLIWAALILYWLDGARGRGRVHAPGGRA